MERVAVFSFARHSPVFYQGVHATEAMDSVPPPALLDWLGTCRKTMVHETSRRPHVFGILHCAYWHCLMNGSNGPGDSAGAPFLCPVCLRKVLHGLAGVSGPPSLGALCERYARMEEALRALAEDMGWTPRGAPARWGET
ncbi:unnamed protein product [Prorocentrum cordatum]|uniref:Anaphase-promoting complex subunit 11 n=1 Tax=Prorocentrum cordatum TaxID=2364126 RepID=A0ABN9VNE0_9DINO|nr:unnamed protein product [Polarella glacialis]